MSPDAEPSPLRTVEIDPDDIVLLFDASFDGWYIEVDWSEWRDVVRGLRRALRERACLVAIPRCRGADHIDLWLREVNALVGQPGAFPSGRAYEMVDLAPGSDIYAIMLCPVGTIPTVDGCS